MKSFPIIAREGWGILVGALIATVVFAFVYKPLAVLAGVFLIFALQFFRDPARPASGDDKDISSPADGRIVFIGEANDPLLNTPALKISVFMNVFNVHSNKAPSTGKVIAKDYFAGSFLNAALDKASIENERCAVSIERADGVKITFIQIAGLVARRILNYVNVGDALDKGDRYGFIRFGSRVDVYLPLTAQPKVAVGDVVANNTTVLARLA